MATESTANGKTWKTIGILSLVVLGIVAAVEGYLYYQKMQAEKAPATSEDTKA
jgi:hypothetical protein